MNSMNRRQFLTMGAGVFTVAAFLRSGSVWANACGDKSLPAPKGVTVAKVDGASEKALQYTPVVTAETKKHPRYKQGDVCQGCQFYQTAQAKEGHAPCTLLANSYVSGCGWCMTFSKKQG